MSEIVTLKKVIFYNNFLNVAFSITIAHTESKFGLAIPHTHSEGTVSQIFDLGFSFYFMPKIGKHFVKFVNIIF